jgi:hypothetical protein
VSRFYRIGYSALAVLCLVLVVVLLLVSPSLDLQFAYLPSEASVQETASPYSVVKVLTFKNVLSSFSA